jgi:hypothetical protein
MPNLLQKRTCSGSRDGVALLAVLACILLLTILVVSYISFTKLNHSATFEYGNSVQAQEIAQGGMQDILSDLHQEIVAGSIVSTNSANFVQGPAPGTPVYVPVNNLAAVPAREGYVNTGASAAWATNATATAFSPSLVRVSRRAATATAGGTAYNPPLPTANYPGVIPLNRASAASTATPSVNGRAISPARWNKTLLLAPWTAAIPSPFSAASTASPPTGAPDWVYVTRAGSRVCQASELTGTPSLLPSNTLNSNYNYTYNPAAPANPPISPVVGRYAFVVYDEGALLDANVAGYTAASVNLVSSPSDPTTGITQAINGKSYLSYADLTQLPGLTGQQPVVDSLVELRNASANINGTQANPYGNNYLVSLISYTKSGFLDFQTSNTGTDSPFLSRQDLINYFAKIDSNINRTSATYSQALPYLGTFSRAVSAPTYSPPLDSARMPGYPSPAQAGTAPVSYHSNAEVSGSINRDLANIRFANAGTVTHYYDDQTGATSPTGTATYSVNVGDPLLQNRFPLSRIAWLSSQDIGGADLGGTTNPATGNGPSTAFATAIQACFGLTWGKVGSGGIANGGNPCWNYVGSPAGIGGTLAAFNGTIETLDQVAKEAREPNFFEMIKAAILSGSLGLSPGPAGWNNGLNGPFDFRPGEGGTPTSITYTIGSESLDVFSFDRNNYTPGQTPLIPTPQDIPDIQIMKIGADIIDQYDADSYPTAIYFHYTGLQNGTLNFDATTFTPRTASPTSGAGDFSGPSDMVYGEENLPYLQAMFEVAGTQTSPSATTGTATLEGWMQPEVWNPHQEPAAANLTTIQKNSVPSTYKIAGYGTGGFVWLNHSAVGPTSGTSETGDLDGSTITFVDSNPTASIFYPNPVPLTTSLGSVSVTAQPGTGLAQGDMIPTQSVGFSANSLVGFYWGKDPNYFYDNNTTAQVRAQLATGMTFTLGWQDPGGNFHPYSYMQQLAGYSYSVLGPEKSDDTRGSDDWHTTSSEEAHVYLDPRTFRFSDLESWTWWLPATTLYSSTALGNPVLDNSGQGRPSASNFFWTMGANSSYLEVGWLANSVNPSALALAATPTYYADPDGVVRPADGALFNPGTGDGNTLFTSPATPSGTGPFAVGDSGGNVQHVRRPVILNRPFRSVGELGYVFRDLPFKTLDFFSTTSADAALLDVFSLTDESKVSNSQLNSVVAGKVSLSNAPLPVIQAILAGGSKKDLDPAYNIGTEESATSSTALAKLALAIASTGPTGALDPTSGPNPLLNRAALVTQLGVDPTTYRGAIRPSGTSLLLSIDQRNKAYVEAPIRALASVTNTRTWNLLIDVIAQSGQFIPGATSLDQFSVQGEKRYWLHVAIDRYTGKIVSQQLEPVYE